MYIKNFIEISHKAQKNARGSCLKFYKNAEIYASGIDNVELRNKIISQTDALLFKYISVAVNLESLWQIYYLKENKIELKKHTSEWQNSLSLTDLIYFENVIIQLRVFIDFAQKLSCLALGYTKPIDGTKDFYKILSNDKSIRDKIVHYDVVKTRSEFRPKIQGKPYEQFCQELQNEMFFFLTELQLILFEKEWE